MPVKAAGNTKARQHTPMVQVLTKAIALLKCFTLDEPEHTIASLCARLDMPKSTIHRLLVTLQQGGMVASDTAGAYTLGMSVLELSSVLLHNIDFRRIARPILQELSDQTGENIYLSTLNSTEIIYLDEIHANRYLTMSNRLGTAAPAYCSAMGKMLLSELSRPQFDRVIAKCDLRARTPKTITDPDSLWLDLRAIAVQGFALDDGEFENGISCIAAPIRSPYGNAIAAFSISAPSARLDGDMVKRLLPQVLRASETISRNLGYTG